MPAVADPANGLLFHELSHPWGHGTPSMPGTPDVILYRSVKHAEHGVMAHRIRMGMHSGTHVNAPAHLVQKGAGVGMLPLERFFGNGVVLSVPKGRWGLVEPEDLVAATPSISAGDIVVIVTGWHRHYSDSLAYFGDSPGLSKAAALWLVEAGVKLVAMDTPQIDHPLATSLAGHRNGPLMKRLSRAYKGETGREPMADHPEWNVAHRILLGAGIPTVENVGGDVSEITGQRVAFQCYPWRWDRGDACPVRFMAMTDPSGQLGLEPGHSEA